MPVTLGIADHPANAWTSSKVTCNEDLLIRASYDDHRASKRIIQSSICSDQYSNTHITPSDNGFVRALFSAYSSHHHLTIRPEDVWFAMLSQINFYINAHAEELRDHFVSHEGKKELELKDAGTIGSYDFGVFARRMTSLLQENVKDPDLRDWIMPTFSTTTVVDRTTAAVIMMATMQSYFSFTCTLDCGIPSVTLLGEREDWEDILQRLDKLAELGDEPTVFAGLLRPIVRRFVSTFCPRPSAATRDFWAKIAHHHSGGSGPSYMSGWLTAFCFWNHDGQSLYKPMDPHSYKFAGMSAEDQLVLDGISYHPVDTDDIPSGFASVPVKVDDNGSIHHTKMIAGSFGIQATSFSGVCIGSHALTTKENEKLDSIQPLSGWLMYELDAEKEAALQEDFQSRVEEAIK